MKRAKLMERYDFAGYVTKYNILCSDGRTIMPGAFKNCDGEMVPLTDGLFCIPENVIGHMILENRDDGVYGYGYLNRSHRAIIQQKLIEDGSIKGLGIYANQLKENDRCVTYAVIRAVMICECPANPGAYIDIINKKGELK